MSGSPRGFTRPQSLRAPLMRAVRSRFLTAARVRRLLASALSCARSTSGRGKGGRQGSEGKPSRHNSGGRSGPPNGSHPRGTQHTSLPRAGRCSRNAWKHPSPLPPPPLKKNNKTLTPTNKYLPLPAVALEKVQNGAAALVAHVHNVARFGAHAPLFRLPPHGHVGPEPPPHDPATHCAAPRTHRTPHTGTTSNKTNNTHAHGLQGSRGSQTPDTGQQVCAHTVAPARPGAAPVFCTVMTSL